MSSTPSDKVNIKSQNEMGLVVFDFDKTIVNAHFHDLLFNEYQRKGKPIPSIGPEVNDIKLDADEQALIGSYLANPITGIKSKDVLKRTIEHLLASGIEVVIQTSSRFKDAITMTLQELGLKKGQIDKIKIDQVQWKLQKDGPNEFEVPDNEARLHSLQGYVRNAVLNNKKAAYLDDSLSFINYVKQHIPATLITCIPVSTATNDATHLNKLSQLIGLDLGPVISAIETEPKAKINSAVSSTPTSTPSIVPNATPTIIQTTTPIATTSPVPTQVSADTQSTTEDVLAVPEDDFLLVTDELSPLSEPISTLTDIYSKLSEKKFSEDPCLEFDAPSPASQTSNPPITTKFNQQVEKNKQDKQEKTLEEQKKSKETLNSNQSKDIRPQNK